MEELKLVSLEQTDITKWDFTAIKEELTKALSVYNTTVYTDEIIDLAKEDKAKLAKTEKFIESQRKAFKAKCMEPYDAIEPQVKELVDMIEQERITIDTVVKDYTERKKSEKKNEIKAYYDMQAHVLGDLAESLFEKLIDPKWLNSSYGKKYRNELQPKIDAAVADIRTIREMNSPFVDTLIEKYVETLSVDAAKAKHDELVTAACKAGLGQQITQTVAATPISEPSFEEESKILVKLIGNKSKITQVMDFAKEIGVRVEIQ